MGNLTTKPLTVCLPPGYDEHPEQRYPVVYHLHGAIGIGNENFAKAGSQFADRLVAEGKRSSR